MKRDECLYGGTNVGWRKGGEVWGVLRILIGIPGDGRTEVSVRRTWLGGSETSDPRRGKEKDGKVDCAALCSCRADEEGEGQQPAPTMCQRRLSVKNQMRENGRADVGTWQPARRDSGVQLLLLLRHVDVMRRGFSFFWAVKFLAFDRRTLSATLTSKPALGLMMLHLLSGANSPKVCLRSRC